MKKKMRNNIIKKSFVTLLAVSVLSTSISITAFAEEDSTLEASEESAVVEEAVPATEDVDEIGVESALEEESVIPLEPTEASVLDSAEDMPYMNVTASSYSTIESYSEFPFTVFINYLYTTDGINYSPINGSKYANRLNGTTTSVKANMLGVFNASVSIPDIEGFSYFGMRIDGCEYDIYISPFDYVPTDWLLEKDVNLDICYFLEDQEDDDTYDVTIKYMYSLPSDPFTYLEFAGSEFEEIYNKNLASKTSVKMNYFPSDMYGYGYGTFVNDFAVTDLSSYGFKSYNMFVPFVEGFTEYGEQGTFTSLPFLDQLYLTRESENVITIIYNLEEIIPPLDDDTPTVDPEVPSEPTEDTVEPEEPSVDPVIPTEPVAPAPVVPEVPVAPIIIVESTPIVEIPPVVEATEIVAAPAYVLPTLLKADKEIIIDIPDEEIPLANIELNKTKTPMGHMHTDPHLCNILSLLLLIALAFVVYSYTQMAKKHDERIYELRLGNKR